MPPIDAVVCHGDACNPNFLIDDDGHFSGYVDLGGLGVADRWADLAPALLSLNWNYGKGWEPTFLDAYGIAPDETKWAFYTDLWNGVADQLGRLDHRAP
ncbi:MAG: phosphotransferase [Micropruina sp.]